MNLTNDINSLTRRIIGACMKVHSGLGPGFPEEYYQRALEHEFAKQSLAHEPQKPVSVLYDGVQVGMNFLDFVVEETVVVEIKSVRALDDVHRSQVIKYLAATGLGVALLVNFGPAKLEFERLLPPKKIQERNKFTAD